MKYKAVIFDLDGTLLYTLGDIALCINSVLYDLDFPVHPEESYKKFVGYGLKEAVERACPADIDDQILDKAYKAALLEYNLNPIVGTIPYPDIPALLDMLIIYNYKLAVLSNKDDILVKHVTNELLSDWPFSSVRGTVPSVPVKPDPTAVYQILLEMDVTPEDAVFVGDSGVDMETAVNSGLLAVGVTWGYREPEELKSSGAKYLIDQPGDLLGILGQ